MKTPFDEVLSVYRDNLDTAIEQDKSAQEFLDSFTIWILGLSIGAVALLLGGVENILKFYSYFALKSTIVLLTLSIITGILHRFLLFNLKSKYNKAMFYVRGALSDKSVMQTEIVDISGIDDMEELVLLLKLDFNANYTKELELYKTLDNENDKKVLFNILVNHYKRTNLWAKTSFENGMEYVTKILKDVYIYQGQDYKTLKEAKNPNIRYLDVIQTLCLYFSCMCFITAIIILAVSF